jgi:hypothetical protein
MSNERINTEGDTREPAKGKPLSFSVQLLAKVLHFRAAQMGMSDLALSQRLFITAGLFRQLDNGIRQGYQLSDPFIECCAEFLDEPWWLVQILAGYLKTEDTATVQAVSGKSAEVAIGEAVDCAREAGLLLEP